MHFALQDSDESRGTRCRRLCFECELLSLQGYVLDTESPAVGAVLGGSGNSGPRGGSRSPGTNLAPSP